MTIRTFLSTVQTTNASPADVATIPVAQGTHVLIEARVVARTGASAGYVLRCRGQGGSGEGATVLNQATDYSYESDAGLDCAFTDVAGDILVTVTGLAATTIDWTCVVQVLTA